MIGHLLARNFFAPSPSILLQTLHPDTTLKENVLKQHKYKRKL